MSQWPIRNVQQLRAEGWERGSLQRAVKSGALWRIRKGYYAEPSAPRPMVRAVRLGGILTAASALQHHRLWTPPDDRLHVLVASNASRLSNPDHRFEPLAEDPNVHMHWTGMTGVRGHALAYQPVDDALSSLTRMAHCAPLEYVTAALDSAMHNRVVRRAALDRVAALHPKLFDALAHCDERADAGGESVVRVRLRLRGLRVQVQVRIDGVGRVDLLVEGRLVIEIDGKQFHDVADQFAEDRRRDRELTIRGYDRLRLTYAQILFDWPATERAIFAALRMAA